MSFLAPWAGVIAAALTVPLLVSLYFLKLRRKPIAVPSTLLWRKSIQDLQVNAPFQRIRNNLLLWLQLLVLALLLIAMARPTQRAAVEPGQRLVIAIDHSASMNTRDAASGQTRLEEAKERALALIDSFETGKASEGGVMVVSFAERATVVQSFTNDRRQLRAAVRGIAATDQRGRIEPALGLISPHAATAAADDDDRTGLSVVILSDGRVHRDGGDDLALSGATLVFERLGTPATANVGIVSASARRDYENPERVAVFARLTHTGAAAQAANVTLRVDGRAVRTKAVELPAAAPGNSVSPESTPVPGTVPVPSGAAASVGSVGDGVVTFNLDLTGGATLEITHDRDDALPVDNTARLQLLPAQQLRVLLVTAGNRYLREAIRAAGARSVEVATPAQFEGMPPEAVRDGDGGRAGFDVVVFDRYSPAGLPLVGTLSFGGTVPVEGFTVRPSADDAPERQAVLTWQRDHPLMRYVVLDDVLLRRPGRLTVPADGRVLAVGLAGPLVAEVRRDGLRHVAVSFDVLESRWPHHWSFQVFMVNALETLGLGAAGGVDAASGGGGASLSYQTGQTATVPVSSETGTIGYDGPRRLSATVRGGRASLPMFERVGFYDADGDNLASPFDRLAVNLLDPLESDVRPAARLEIGSSAGPSVAAAEGARRREVWPWFAWGALGLLVVEWVVYTQRMRV
ncbi:MAG: BatA and WFA domain-containing protein [Planctomycetota bacterium]